MNYIICEGKMCMIVKGGRVNLFLCRSSRTLIFGFHRPQFFYYWLHWFSKLSMGLQHWIKLVFWFKKRFNLLSIFDRFFRGFFCFRM